MWAWVRHADSSWVRAGVHSPKFVLAPAGTGRWRGADAVLPSGEHAERQNEALAIGARVPAIDGPQAVVGTVMIDTL